MPVGASDPAMAPDPRLVQAAAMVFVADLARPVVEPADARHLLDVLRLRPGETVIVSDGSGSWIPCRLTATGRSARTADLTSMLAADGEVVTQKASESGLTIAFAPVKGERPEWVVQKLTELGIDRIAPIHTRRSVVRWEGERSARMVERFRKVALEASAQCRRPRLPEILPVSSLSGLATMVGLQPVLAHPGGSRPNAAHQLVAVGPEGGWDESELTGDVATIGLGPTVLRAETAAVVVGTLLCAVRSTLVRPLA